MSPKWGIIAWLKLVLLQYRPVWNFGPWVCTPSVDLQTPTSFWRLPCWPFWLLPGAPKFAKRPVCTWEVFLSPYGRACLYLEEKGCGIGFDVGGCRHLSQISGLVVRWCTCYCLWLPLNKGVRPWLRNSPHVSSLRPFAQCTPRHSDATPESNTADTRCSEGLIPTAQASEHARQNRIAKLAAQKVP